MYLLCNGITVVCMYCLASRPNSELDFIHVFHTVEAYSHLLVLFYIVLKALLIILQWANMATLCCMGASLIFLLLTIFSLFSISILPSSFSACFL